MGTENGESGAVVGGGGGGGGCGENKLAVVLELERDGEKGEAAQERRKEARLAAANTLGDREVGLDWAAAGEKAATQEESAAAVLSVLSVVKALQSPSSSWRLLKELLWLFFSGVLWFGGIVVTLRLKLLRWLGSSAAGVRKSSNGLEDIVRECRGRGRDKQD